MLYITICDDDDLFLDTLENKLIQYLTNVKEISFQITRCCSITELLQSNICQAHIIFLDMKFQEMTGIKAASMIRKSSPNFILIFVSGFIEYAPAGYSVNALRYILKDQLDIFLNESVDEAVYKLGYQRNSVSFRFIGYECEQRIYTDCILYLESNLHEVHFHFTDGHTSYLYNTLNIIQQLLPENEFIRIHQSYLVNLKYFIDAKNYQAILHGNCRLPISQKLFSEVKKQLFLYRGRL